MRLSIKNARKSSKGNVFSGKHNDRNYDYSKDGHINEDCVKDNIYLLYDLEGNETDQEKSFLEHEFEQYGHLFSDWLKERNKRYSDKAYYNRAKSMGEYFRSPQTCPEETIFMIGNKNEHPDGEELLEIYREFIRKHQEMYGSNCILLDASLHVDEATPHIHLRKVWVSHDANGFLKVGQKEALNEMGIERPFLEQPEDRYNNAKTAYTESIRSIMTEICIEHGIDIDCEPDMSNRRAMTMNEYKANIRKAECAFLEKEIIKKKEELEKLSSELKSVRKQYSDLNAERKQLEDKTAFLNWKSRLLDKREEALKKMESLAQTTASEHISLSKAEYEQLLLRVKLAEELIAEMRTEVERLQNESEKVFEYREKAERDLASVRDMREAQERVFANIEQIIESQIQIRVGSMLFDINQKKEALDIEKELIRDVVESEVEKRYHALISYMKNSINDNGISYWDSYERQITESDFDISIIPD